MPRHGFGDAHVAAADHRRQRQRHDGGNSDRHRHGHGELVEQPAEQAALEAQKAREQATREVSAEKLLLRRKLREQLNKLLDTRESEAGLVVSLSDLRRCLAESAMFGGHALGGPWGLRGENGGGLPILLRDAAWRQTNRRLTDFYREKWDLFGAAVDASPVAILYNFESLLGDEPAYRRACESMTQVLQRHQIPFRYVLSDRLAKLDDVQVLVLPHVLPLAAETEAAIRAWVQRGGRVLATGHCSLYDHWMRQRTDYALGDLFGAHFSNAFEDGNHDAMVRNPDTGCVLLPGAWGQMLGNDQPACLIPEDRVAREIRAMLPADTVDVRSPVPQVGCAWSRLPDGSQLLSLLNYGEDPVHGLEIRWSAGKRAPTAITAFDAMGSGHALPVIAAGDGMVCVRPPALDVELFLQVS